MKFISNNSQNRREFLRNGLRYPVLGGLLVLSALLAGKRASASGGAACLRQGLCAGCWNRDACLLPPALTARGEANRASR